MATTVEHLSTENQSLAVAQSYICYGSSGPLSQNSATEFRPMIFSDCNMLNDGYLYHTLLGYVRVRKEATIQRRGAIMTLALQDKEFDPIKLIAPSRPPKDKLSVAGTKTSC